jgi:Domain of unknown function (DUF4062)
MALKIFISSVYRELREERQALLEEIQKLQDLFVGMELFGSDPGKPADYCARQVEESDLYLGLFGNDYGSVDEATDVSFTQLEYEAAVKRIPCLIFLKADADADQDARLVALKERLRRNHVVYFFKNVSDLRHQFLIDFIKLLRSDLFDKIIPVRRGDIPADALLSLTQGFIRELIKSVGHDKYISELYVTREAEKDIEQFTDFENTFRARMTTILEHMDLIRRRYRLGDEAAIAVSQAKLALGDVLVEGLRDRLDELKRVFHFYEVEDAIETVNSLIMETSDGRFGTGVNDLLLRWSGQSFVDHGRLLSAEEDIAEERRRSLTRRALQTDQPYRKLLCLFPSYTDENLNIHLANDYLKELSRLIDIGLKRCLVLVDKAGTGKTNIACRIAEQLVVKHPVVLLSGQMELSSEYDIEFHIQRRLESAFSGVFSDWMNRVSPSLQAAHKWLFIIIDGINENSRRPLLIRLLRDLLPKLEERRIKLILTCRDLFWDVFRDTLEPYLFRGAVSLNEFTEAEWHRAIKAYFQRFNIECTLGKGAEKALRNPLLLRFFCEVNKGLHLGRVANLRLLSVFHLYVERAGLNISERHASLHPGAVLDLLLGIARQMWEQRSISVSPTSAGVGTYEQGESGSVYNRLLSENLVIEETRHTYSARKSIRFLYDEFMEYMIARSWVDEISEADDGLGGAGRLLQEAAESLGSFPPALGAVIFLDQMLERGGRLVNEFIKRASKLGDFFMESQQTSLVYAFESIAFGEDDDELIAVIENFEPTLREELRERLAAVILNIFKARPDHPFVKRYINQVLEVGREGGADAAQTPGRRAPGSRKRLPETAAARPHLKRAPASAPSEAAKVHGLEPAGKKEKEVPRLPPGRYHYSEETKINAIGVLVQMKDQKEYALIEEGIRKIGRTDLHSALQALEYLDLARDEVVYQTVTSYMKVMQSEYRIYCAWLLRERYGRIPAACMARLLIDDDTRVHQYAVSLFERRLVERDLLEELLNRLGECTDVKPWHLSHFIKLLGMRDSFRPSGSAEVYGARIVEALVDLLDHGYASIRLEAYRAILKYPSLISLDTLKECMSQDEDIYIRRMADKLTPPA